MSTIKLYPIWLDLTLLFVITVPLKGLPQ